MPHQPWKWLTDVSSYTVYLQDSDNSWTTYQQVPSPLHSTRSTRQAKILYNRETCSHPDPNLWSLVQPRCTQISGTLASFTLLTVPMQSLPQCHNFLLQQSGISLIQTRHLLTPLNSTKEQLDQSHH
jgi:hypothetical protein